MISGAMYAGVPHYSLIISALRINLLTPKSQIFTVNSLSRSMLSSLISLCKIPLWWQWAIPSTIYFRIHFALSSCILPFSLILVNRSPEDAYSITMKKFDSFSKTSKSLIILTWTSFFRIRTSYKIFILEKSFFIYILSMHLIATNLLVSISRPRCTFPKLPFPSNFTSW